MLTRLFIVRFRGVRVGGFSRSTNYGRVRPLCADKAQGQDFSQPIGAWAYHGASDDDPSGIATYSKTGAQFGYGMLWVMLFSYPLMCAIQEISARIGRVTGKGIAANMRTNCMPIVRYGIVGLLCLANIFNLGADFGAMGAAAHLVLPGSAMVYVILFAVVSLALQVFVCYTTYVKYLKWLTAAVFAYVLTAFVVHVPWTQAARYYRTGDTYQSRILRDVYCCTRNNNQPVSLLLASLSGGRRSRSKQRRTTAQAQAGSSRTST